MSELLDKVIIFAFCVGLYAQASITPYMVVPIIIAVAVSSFFSYTDRHRLRQWLCGGYGIGCIFYPQLLYFLPLLAYDIYVPKQPILILLVLFPLILSYTALSNTSVLLLVIFIGIAWLMRYRTNQLIKLRREYTALRDSTTEFSLQLEHKNKELLEKQDYEINLATLNERNRIAREIHDNVGHVLSSSILQLGALIATSKDEKVKENLLVLKDTLTQGMDSIRHSIHNLHDESVDLYAEIYTLTEGFHFCPVSLDYDCDSTLPLKLKYTFIAIVKEALANIMKHSNATHVEIVLREHPALYQLIIRDNGTKAPQKNYDGIGLRNMADRVASHQGVMNITTTNGYVIFISIPKEKL